MRLYLWNIDPLFPKERWNEEWEQYEQDRMGKSDRFSDVEIR